VIELERSVNRDGNAAGETCGGGGDGHTNLQEALRRRRPDYIEKTKVEWDDYT
jgi:hypothetical protein